MIPVVEPATCTACGDCVDVCPSECIEIVDGVAVIEERFCEECGECVDVCAVGAITLPGVTG